MSKIPIKIVPPYTDVAGGVCTSRDFPAADCIIVTDGLNVSGGVIPMTAGDYAENTANFLMQFVPGVRYGANINPIIGGGTTTVTRALNTATRVNASGLIEVVNANLPRFDYDPVTLALKGLLIEEARTNIALQANAFNTAPWADLGTPAATQNALGSDGTISAWTLTDNDAGQFEGKTQVITIANDSSIYAIGVNVRKTFGGTSATVGVNTSLGGGTIQTCHPRLNTDTGAVQNVGAHGSVYVEDAGDWWRVFSVITNNTTGNVTLTVQLYPTTAANGSFADVATATGSAIFERLQAEVAPDGKGTSYIDTAAVAVTRNVDDISLALGAWYSATEGTVFSEWVPRSASAMQAILSIDDGTLNNRMAPFVNAAQADLQTSVAGIGQTSVAAGTITANAVNRQVFNYKLNDYANSVNGSAVVTDLTATVPTVTKLRLGATSDAMTVPLNGWLRKVAYWTPKQVNAALPLLSA